MLTPLFIYRETTDGPQKLGRHDKTGFDCRQAEKNDLTVDRLVALLEEEEAEFLRCATDDAVVEEASLLGAHDALRGLMVRVLGENITGRIFRELVDRGGFRGLARKK